MKPSKWLSSCLFALPSVLFAQNSVDYNIFKQAAEGYSNMFRGAFPVDYGDKKPNDGSTYYAYSSVFEKGNVLFRGKLYKDVLLNLNAHRDELCVMDANNGVVVVLNKHFVDSFSMGTGRERQFVHFKQEANPVLSNGYYESIYSGKFILYKKILKQYDVSISYSLLQMKSYILSESFYLQKNGIWYRVGAKRDLKKLFANQKREIDQLCRTRNLDFKKNKEYALIQTLLYLSEP